MCGKQELNGADSAPPCPLCKGYGTMRGGDEEVPCPKCSRPVEATFSEWMEFAGIPMPSGKDEAA